MVDPDLVSGLDTNGITSISQNFGDLDVADDNVVYVQHAEANTVKGCNFLLVSGPF